MRSTQKGNILILFSLTVAIFTGLFFIFGQGVFALKKIKGRSDQKLLILDSEKTMLLRLAKRVHEIVRLCNAPICPIVPATPAGFTTLFNSAPVPSPQILSQAELTQLIAANGPMRDFNEAKEAVARCATAPKWTAEQVRNVAYYLCVRFPSDDSEGTLFSAPHFAEFRVNAINLNSPNPKALVNLAAYSGLPLNSGALRLYYRIYWTKPGDLASRFVRTGEAIFSQQELQP